jgi:hypothetical protein
MNMSNNIMPKVCERLRFEKGCSDLFEILIDHYLFNT